jgi:dihydroflavonol-4-reductase
MTILELFKLIAEAAGVRPPAIRLPNLMLHSLGKIGDVLESKGLKAIVNSENAWTSTMYHWFDNTKAKKELGLEFSSAKNAIHSSVQWMKEKKIIV